MYLLKLLGVDGIWNNRNTDKHTHKAAKAYQKMLNKYLKAKHDVNFLNQSKEEVFPKFLQSKNIKSKNHLERNRYLTRNLNDAINKRCKELDLLKKGHDYSKGKLLSSTTCMKGQIILFSINRVQSKRYDYIKEKHQKKLDTIIVNKTIRDGIKKNPNSITTNLTDKELTESEASVIKYSLKHGLLTRPKESEMVVIVEDIWDHILQNDVLKEDHISKHRLQTALKAFTYN